MERYPGMDVRGDGGYCIILGRSAVGEYEWLLDTTDAYVIDPAIWEVIQPSKPKKAKAAPKTNAKEKTNGSGKRVDSELLVRTALGKVTAGMGRNNAGAWLAIQLRDNNYSAKETLAVAFSERCPPTDACGDENPYTSEEWASTVESIYSKPAREPWNEPEETPPPLMLPAPVLLSPSDSAEIPFSDPAQAAAPVKVDIADLLTKICTFTRKFVRMSDAQHAINALWVVHTHAIEAADFTPYPHVHSPVLRSGKTRLLEVNELLVSNPWCTGRTTVSSLVRKIDKFKPTLLLDESDAVFNVNTDYTEALRGVLNTGFERGGVYTMSVSQGKDWEPRDFSTFCPKMIAGIGKGMPTTVKDRSLPFELKRRLRSEPIERFRKRKVKPEGAELQRLAALWARDNGVVLGKATPELPESLDDRRWDVIEPLLAIADMAEGEWPAQARAALVELCGTGSADSTELCIRLLADIRSIFKEKNEDELQTEILLGSLMALSESPWREYNRNGSPITARQLADLLRDFGIGSRDIHTGTGKGRKSLRGYVKGDFKDAWERYLPAESNAPTSSESTQHPRQPRQANVYACPASFRIPAKKGLAGIKKVRNRQ
jgi:hypothetical protein